MNFIQRAALQTDLLLINKVFMPLAHWIDWRFHRSPYQQAYRVVQVAQAMQIGSTAFTAWRVWWIAPLMLAVTVMLFFIFRTEYRRLEKCQRQLEKDPGTLIFEQMIYMGPLIFPLPPPRLLMLVCGFWLALAMMPLVVMDGHWDALLNSWVMVNGVALYLAGSFPPMRPRREKKAKEQEWALPVMTPMGT